MEPAALVAVSGSERPAQRRSRPFPSGQDPPRSEPGAGQGGLFTNASAPKAGTLSPIL